MVLLCLFFRIGPCDFLVAAEGSPAKIIKVLPHFLDKEGRKSLSPSLYERDAYQVVLRKDRTQCSALRYDIQWKATGLAKSAEKLKLRLELRTTKGSSSETTRMEQAVVPRSWGSRWSAITLDGKIFEEIGEVSAWRVTLIQGDKTLAEQKSFLW